MRNILAELEAKGVRAETIIEIKKWHATHERHLLRCKKARAHMADVRARVSSQKSPVSSHVSSQKNASKINGHVSSHRGSLSSLLTSRVKPQSPRFLYPVEFEQLYAAYPLHQDKRAAHKKWLLVLKQGRATNDELIAGAQRYADDPNRVQEFTKHLATWLHNDCWTNGPLPERKERSNHGRRQFIP